MASSPARNPETGFDRGSALFLAGVAWLAILYSSPIWWGLIELFIATFSDLAPSFLSHPVEWAYTFGLKLILQTLGLLVALIIGLVLTGLTGFAAIFTRLQ